MLYLDCRGECAVYPHSGIECATLSVAAPAEWVMKCAEKLYSLCRDTDAGLVVSVLIRSWRVALAFCFWLP